MNQTTTNQKIKLEVQYPQTLEQLRYMMFETIGHVDFYNVNVNDLSYAHARMAYIYLDELTTSKEKVQELKELCAVVRKQYLHNERLIDFLLRPILKQCVF